VVEISGLIFLKASGPSQQEFRGPNPLFRLPMRRSVRSTPSSFSAATATRPAASSRRKTGKMA